MAAVLSHDDAPLDLAEIARRLGSSALACAAFGAAVGGGRGARAMLDGAWTAPALIVGGAVLALPPLYLATALTGGRATPAEVARTAGDALSRVSTVLLGLAAPALFFSVTLTSVLGSALLTTVLVVLGAAGIGMIAREALAREDETLPRLGAAAWLVFAVALGARLMASLGAAAGLVGGR